MKFIYKINHQQIDLLYQLLLRDFFIFKITYFHKLRIALIRFMLSIFVAKTLLPSMGLINYGPFILISSMTCYGFFIAAFQAIEMIYDLTEQQAIYYELTLPIKPLLILVKYSISTALQAAIISISLLPFGMIVLGTIHPFTCFSLLKFLLMLSAASIFYGSFMLILASITPTMLQVENLWLRLIFPMWYLGCFQFSWQSLYTVLPICAYLDCLNPMTWIMEGMRSATIQTTGPLPFYGCVCITLLYAALAFLIGSNWMKKRLDCL